MFLQGVFWGIVYSVIPAFIADAVPDQVRGTGIGTYRTFMDMGGLVGPIIMSNLVNYLGYPQGYMYSFYVGSAILLGCLALIVGLKERR
jgi:MFS family permease